MSLDQDLKNAFERHARDAQPDDEAWQTIERRIRRAHKQRFALVSTLTVALIAAAAVLVPRIGTKDESRGFTNPSVTPTASAGRSTPTPTATPTPIESPPAGPAIPAGWQRRVGVQSGFQLGIPGDWKGGWFEGTWDFEPKGLPGGAQDGDTFLVTITVVDGNFDAVGGPFVNEIINGRRAAMWQLNPGDAAVNYSIDWDSLCPRYSPACAGSPTHALRVTVRATNQQLWSRYEAIGKQVVQTISGYDGSTSVHGNLSPYVPMNDYTRALIRFLDARVEGIGADELACCNAATYLSKNDEFYLVAGKPITDYLVRTGDKFSGGGYAYEVEWYNADKSGEMAEVMVDYHSSAQPLIVDIGSAGGRPIPVSS